MSAVKLVSLYRCSSIENEAEISDRGETIEFFITDYFDGIQTETFYTDDGKTLAECMGIQMNANRDKSGVSHHRYWLYSAKEQKGDPDIFAADAEYPVLTIVQVFLNPDFYQAKRFHDFNKETVNEENCLKLLEEVLRKNGFNSVKLEVFRLLTSGNFAVIVRSKTVRDAYDVAAAIREIRISYMFEGKEDPGHVAFHTYSIFGIDDRDISSLIKARKEKEDIVEHPVDWTVFLNPKDRVVLRLRFAQKFNGMTLSSDIGNLLCIGRNLAGRYDYEISLSPEDFNFLYPYIRRYKFIDRAITFATQTDIPLSDSSRLMIELMKDGCLSYINERVQLYYDKSAWPVLKEPVTWKVETDHERISLFTLNGNLIEKLWNYANELQERAAYLYKHSRNLQEYMRLFVRFTRILHDVNYRRELRISVSNLLQQYNAILKGLEAYLDQADIYKEELITYREKQAAENDFSGYSQEIDDSLRNIKTIASRAENEISHGMYSLEMFLRYLRNINFQTLQTPNFDLQTNICIEKLLVAHSHFMQRFITKRESPYISTKQLYPILIPNLTVDDFSVRVLFDLDLEENVEASTETTHAYAGENEGSGGKLAVVYSPTFAFLCESCFLIPAVFHEIAHQFRYEKREKRNGALWRYNIRKLIRYVVYQLIDEKREYDFRANDDEILTPIYSYIEDSCFVESQENVHNFEDSLIQTVLNARSAIINQEDSFEEACKKYIDKTKASIQLFSDPRLTDALDQYHCAYNEIQEKKKALSDILPKDLTHEKATEKIDYTALFDALKLINKVQYIQLMEELIEEIKSLNTRIHAETTDKLEENLLKIVKEFSDSDYSPEAAEIAESALIDWWSDYEEFCKLHYIDSNRVAHLLIHQQDNRFYYKNLTDNTSMSCNSADIISIQFFQELCKRLQVSICSCMDSLSSVKNRLKRPGISSFQEERIEYIRKKYRLMSEKVFRNSVIEALQKVNEEEIFDDIHQNCIIYREATSDLYMCAMMDLDLWGYLAVISEMFVFTPDNQEIQYLRIGYVLQSMYKKTKEAGAKEEFTQYLTHLINKNLSQLYTAVKEFYKQKQTDSGTKIPANYKKWMEYKICEEDETLDKYQEFLDFFPEDVDGSVYYKTSETDEPTAIFTNTQRWIIRMCKKILAIVRSITLDEPFEEDFEQKIFLDDLTNEHSYYSCKADLHDLLKENATGSEEIFHLCENITAIMNNPAKFFNKKKELLSDEIQFILSEYEESCNQAFPNMLKLSSSLEGKNYGIS